MAKNFAAALTEQLEVAGMTGYRLSQLTGISRQTVSRLLNGHVQPGWDVVAKIAKALGVSCEAFVTDDMSLPEAPDERPRGRPPIDSDATKPTKAKRKK